MKKKEIVIFAVLFIVALACILVMRYTGATNDKLVIITVDNKHYKTIEVDEDTIDEFTIETQHGTNTVTIKNGYINVISADCPTQVCVHTKQATNVGDQIVCLPHKVIIEIKDND